MLLVLLALALVAASLAVFLLAPEVARWRRRRARAAAARGGLTGPLYDPGLERRAEQRARELLRSCVNETEWAMYRDLGFIRVEGRVAPDRGRAQATPGVRYAYLIYPHKPIVSYVPETGQLLSEYCIEFPDLSGAAGRTRLPASDDVLAKWMALTSHEERVIRRANMHLVGQQMDPAKMRRDLWRLAEWDRLRRRRRAASVRRAGSAPGPGGVSSPRRRSGGS